MNNKGAILTFFSINAPRWEDTLFKGITIENRKSASKFCVFGNYDILLLAFNDSIEELQKLQEDLHRQHPELSQDYHYYFGTLYHPEERNLDLNKLCNDFPFLTVSFLKFKKQMWGSLKNGVEIEAISNWLKEQIESAIKDIGAKAEFIIITSCGGIELNKERLFNDILADYFCGVIGFNGDWKNCRRLFQEYEKKLSPYKEFSEVEYRLSAAEAIHKYIKGL